MLTNLNVPSAAALSGDYDGFCEVATDFLEGIDPQDVLQSITEEDVARSIIHPNGFFVAFVTDREERTDRQLRLHLWPSGIDRTDGDIHTHPWHMASLGIYGPYLEQIATVEPDVINPNYQSLAIESGMTGAPIIKPELVRVTMSDMVEYAPGVIRHLPNTAYHYTPVEGPLITLALMGNMKAGNRFLRPVGQLPPGNYPIPFNPDADTVAEIWGQIQAIQAA